jgi:hypothetical protein
VIDRATVAGLLHAGLSDRAIARRLGVNTRRIAPIRTELGLPKAKPGPQQPPSLAEAWRARTRQMEGGHLKWTGHTDDTRLPRLKYRGGRYSPHRLAFRLRTGRDPVGNALPDCGMRLCVAPDHVDDAAGRATYDAIFGRTA